MFAGDSLLGCRCLLVGVLVFARISLLGCWCLLVGLLVFAGVCLVVSWCWFVGLLVFVCCFVDGIFHFLQPLIIGQRCPSEAQV